MAQSSQPSDLTRPETIVRFAAAGTFIAIAIADVVLPIEIDHWLVVGLLGLAGVLSGRTLDRLLAARYGRDQ